MGQPVPEGIFEPSRVMPTFVDQGSHFMQFDEAFELVLKNNRCTEAFLFKSGRLKALGPSSPAAKVSVGEGRGESH